MANVLIATLGDYPAVVTEMCTKLEELEIPIKINKIIVLRTSSTEAQDGYELLSEVCEGSYDLESYVLDGIDVATRSDCYAFLGKLFSAVKSCQNNKDSVYLSLTGGRKNMSALMALVAPFYDCVQALYQVINRDTSSSHSDMLTAMEMAYDTLESKREKMFATWEGLELVRIPFDNSLRLDPSYRHEIETMNEFALEQRWEKLDESDLLDEQIIVKLLRIQGANELLDVYLTDDAVKEYKYFCEHEPDLAGHFARCFRSMQFAVHLADEKRRHDNKSGKVDGKTHPFHYYKKGHTKERPFFCTWPDDIANYPYPGQIVRQVIIAGLAAHRSDNSPLYEPGVKQLLARVVTSDIRKLHALEDVLQEAGKDGGEERKKESVLIVQLGESPMVATQAYTLLKETEALQRDIKEVHLVYPGRSGTIAEGVRLLVKLFSKENIPCKCREVDLADIDTDERCQLYQDTLESIIMDLKQEHKNKGIVREIDLVISGGRKGMAAMAIFAAQRTGVRSVYHTLVTDTDLEDYLTRLTVNDLSEMKPDKRRDLMFLHKYQDQMDKFTLFRVPIGPLVTQRKDV